MTIWTREFWKATAERCVRAFAAGASGSFVAGATDLAEVPWRAAGTAGLVAAILALLFSLGANSFTGGGGPALNSDETLRRR